MWHCGFPVNRSSLHLLHLKLGRLATIAQVIFLLPPGSLGTLILGTAAMLWGSPNHTERQHAGAWWVTASAEIPDKGQHQCQSCKQGSLWNDSNSSYHVTDQGILSENHLPIQLICKTIRVNNKMIVVSFQPLFWGTIHYAAIDNGNSMVSRASEDKIGPLAGFHLPSLKDTLHLHKITCKWVLAASGTPSLSRLGKEGEVGKREKQYSLNACCLPGRWLLTYYTRS